MNHSDGRSNTKVDYWLACYWCECHVPRARSAFPVRHCLPTYMRLDNSVRHDMYVYPEPSRRGSKFKPEVGGTTVAHETNRSDKIRTPPE